MLDLRRLTLLREVKLRGTLAEVAAALNYSPSAVSQQLTLLEKEVGVPLLRKSGRRVTLTPQAEILISHTSTVLDVLEQAEAEVTSSLVRPTGVVRLALFQSAALALLPEVLSVIRRDHPEIRLEVTQQEPEAALYATWARDFDVVVAEEYPHHAVVHHTELERVDLLKDPIRLGIHPSLRELRSVKSLADTSQLPWVMEPRGTASRHWAEQACRQAGFEPDVQFETADIQAHIRLVESGNAVALLTGLAWAGRPVSVDLIDLPGNPGRTVFAAARRVSVTRPAIQLCLDAMVKVAAKV
jgi:DNA-binding transcriptional LysR family regulator